MECVGLCKKAPNGCFSILFHKSYCIPIFSGDSPITDEEIKQSEITEQIHKVSGLSQYSIQRRVKIIVNRIKIILYSFL